MPTVTTQSSARLQGQAEKIYRVLADYRQHHPHVLPQKYFRKLEVEAGGVGAGTIFNAETVVYGTKSSFHMQVSEPQPGRLLAETDLNTGLITTFTVEPHGDQSQVTIASRWERPAGLKSWLESTIRAAIMRRMYKEELAQIEHYVGQLP